MGATAILSAFVERTTYDDIPEEARTLALRTVLDCIAVALAAANEPPGKIIHEMVKEGGGTAEGRLLGHGTATNSIQAAWANGAFSHLLDYDDTGFSHPTACILPAALAAGERVDCDGKAFVTAMVVGYEVFERIAVSARPYEPTLRARGYHPTSLYGAPAAAAAACSIMGLNAEQTAIAMGLAAASSSGLTQHFGTWGKGVQAGTAARAAMTSTIMASKGYWASDMVLEGPYGFFNAIHGEDNYDLSNVGTDLGKQWAIIKPGLTVKQYPACGALLRAIDAAIELREEHQIKFDQVEKITVDVHADILNTVRFHKPTRGFEGKFSVDYTVAAAVLDGRVDVDTFSDEYCNSPRMRDALDRTEVVPHHDWEDSMESRRRQPVTVTMKDGHSVSAVVPHPLGSRENPMTREQLHQKFRDCASRILPDEKVERSISLIENIADEARLSTLIDALVVD